MIKEELFAKITTEGYIQVTSNVVDVWMCLDCGTTATIESSDWYEENGTPICECGEDMKFDSSWIKQDKPMTQSNIK